MWHKGETAAELRAPWRQFLELLVLEQQMPGARGGFRTETGWRSWESCWLEGGVWKAFAGSAKGRWAAQELGCPSSAHYGNYRGAGENLVFKLYVAH